jgi:hypothetical protein
MEVIDNKIYDKVHATWWNEDGFMAILCCDLYSI